MFIKYRKIYNIDKDEAVGILDDMVSIQEKIDGANLSAWIEDGKIVVASRNRVITEGFRGAVDYINNHKGIKQLLTDNPGYRLYLEWLVKHTVSYPADCYNKSYLFDILTDDGFMKIENVIDIAEKYGIEYPKLFLSDVNISLDRIKEIAGKSFIGKVGEGVVIKSESFVNIFGDRCYAKYVTDNFKEQNRIEFNNLRKDEEGYSETNIAHTFVTEARVSKICNKLSIILDRELNKRDTARVLETVYRDILVEEIYSIQKKYNLINFRLLKKIIAKKTSKIFFETIL